MSKSDFQILVPFVKSTEKYDCSFAKEVDLKRSRLLIPTVCKKKGKDIRTFYEDLVKSDVSISPWSDTAIIQNQNITEPIDCITINGEEDSRRVTGSKRKEDYSTTSETQVKSEPREFRTNNSEGSKCSKRKKDYSTSSSKIQVKSEPVDYRTNNGEVSTRMKRKKDYSTSSKIRIKSEPVDYSYDTYNNEGNTCLKRKKDYSTSSKAQVYSMYSSPATTHTATSSPPRSKRKSYTTCFATGVQTSSSPATTSTNFPFLEPLPTLNRKSVPAPSKSQVFTAPTARTNTNSSVKLGESHKTKLNTTEKPSVEMPMNSQPVFCRNTDDIVKMFSEEHIQNAILKCAQEGDLPGLKQHLQSGSVNVNCTDSFGWTPLMCASVGGHIDVVKFLLSLDGVDDSYRNHKGQSALGLSTKGKHWEIRILLESHLRDPLAYSSSQRKEEDREKSQKQDQRPRLTSEYFCDVCRVRVRNTTKSTHESSTVHLLNINPEPLPESYFLSEQNRGFQIMVRTGWDESKGLGPSGEGRRIPIKTVLKRDRKGLGVKSSDMARISHFDAKDAKAVKYKQVRGIKALNKKKLAQIQQREKRKERDLRRCLDFN